MPHPTLPPIAERITPAAVTPPRACQICGSMVAASTLTNDPVIGLACVLCTAAVSEIRRRYAISESRARRAYESQLRRVVKEVRAGTTEYPTFDQPDF